MPLFEFNCRACGRRFEILVMGQRTPTCPHCESPDLAKQFSTFGMTAAGGSKGRASAAPRFT